MMNGDCSPVDLKVLEAKRARSNHISQLMGDYMLRGYRMLDRLCEECGTVMLQDRQKNDHCVSCKDLGDDGDGKDDPATNEAAALASVLEQQQQQQQQVVQIPKLCASEEAELKRKQQHNDKLSSLMGSYMLRGFKMLDENCALCSTILLQSRAGVKKCIACEDMGKAPAAPSSFHKYVSNPPPPQQQQQAPQEAPAPQQVHSSKQQQRQQQQQAAVAAADPQITNLSALTRSTSVLIEKIEFLSNKLAGAASVPEICELSGAIKLCADCLVSLNRVGQPQ